MRKLVILAMASLLALFISGCGTSQSGHDPAPLSSDLPASVGAQPSSASALPQTGWTEAVPAAYKQPSERPGSVERLDYDSLDYAGDGHAVTKAAYVYTPY